jgi:CubicO group peptidase (beta-lactamase class C family)
MTTWERLAALTFALATGCASRAVSPAATGAAQLPLRPLAPPRLGFEPPRATPARKAKLQALAPKLDELFRTRAAELGATGAAVAILLEGEVVYLRGFGVRDVVSKVAVDADTVFRIGSVSKTLTALGVMRLRDQGKLVLDAPAVTYLPELRSLAAPTRDSPPITVRHLLTMTSGLGYDDVWGAVTFGKSNAELAAFLAAGVPLAGAPGERYRYSNLGFALLGQIVARVSGTSFEQFQASEVFAPLGLTSTGYVTGKLPTGKWATGYYRDQQRLVPEPIESDGVFAPAGGVYTTARDLARYAAFQLAAYPPRDALETGPVRRSTLREMHGGQAWARFADDMPVLARNPEGAAVLTAMSYGLGWAQNTTCLSEGMVQHGGYEPGYWAAIRLLPQQGLGFVALSTTESIGKVKTFEQAMAILREGGVFEAPSPPPSERLVFARETVLRLLAAWSPELAAQSFDPQSLRYSFLRNLRPDFERMRREHGACRAGGEITPMGLTQGRFTLTCDRGGVDVIVYLTPGVPALLQNVEYRQRLPVSEPQQLAADAVISALNGAALPADTLATGSDARRLERVLARLHGNYGACEREQALFSDGKGQATFRLRCAEGPLELTLSVDPQTSLVSEIVGAQPRAYGAVCAE